MPKISVIVPVYNVQEYLESCLNSILAQTFSDIQIILVDDGSEDDSGKICDNYQSRDDRIFVIHQKNCGLIRARAAGVQIAVGEWVCFVDSDDMIAPDALERMYSYVSDDIDFVVFESHINTICKPQEYVQLLFKFQLLSIWGKLFRRHLFNDYVLSIPSKFQVGEDFLYQLRILCGVNRKIRICLEKKYIYNTSNVNSVQRAHKKSYEYEMALLTEVADIMKNMQLADISVKVAYLKWRIVYLGGMIGLRYPVDYKSIWVTQLKNECKNYNLSFKESLIISAIDVPFLRIFLIMEKGLKRKARSLINIIKKQ